MFGAVRIPVAVRDGVFGKRDGVRLMRKDFVTLSVTGPCAALLDVPGIVISSPRNVISGKPLSSPMSVSVRREDGRDLTFDILVEQAWEIPAIRARLEKEMVGFVYAVECKKVDGVVAYTMKHYGRTGDTPPTFGFSIGPMTHEERMAVLAVVFFNSRGSFKKPFPNEAACARAAFERLRSGPAHLARLVPLYNDSAIEKWLAGGELPQTPAFVEEFGAKGLVASVKAQEPKMKKRRRILVKSRR